MSSDDTKMAWLKTLGVGGGEAPPLEPSDTGKEMIGSSGRVVAAPGDVGNGDDPPAKPPADDIGTADRARSAKGIKTMDTGLDRRTPLSVPPPKKNVSNNGPKSGVNETQPPPSTQYDKVPARSELYKPVKGDGEVVPGKKALAALQENPDLVGINGPGLHRTKWRSWLGNQGEPPSAFRADGKIQVNPNLLPPDEFAALLVIDAEKLHVRVQNLRGKAADLRKQLDANLPEKERLAVGRQLRNVETAAQAFESDLKAMAERLEAMPEMEGFRGTDPRETFKAAREKFLKSSGALKKLGAALGLLVTGFGILMELKGIFEADTAQEAMDRAAGLGRGIRDQVVTSAVIESFFPKGPPGVSLMVGLCGDNGTGAGCEPDQDKVREERQKAKTEVLNEAFLSFMKEMHPELFVRGPNGTYPSNEKLWNESRQQFEEAFERHQKESVAKRAEELAERMRTLQIENGLYDSPVNPYTPEDADADPFDQERAKVIGTTMEKARQEGYKEGKARRDAIWKRANDLGLKDGKTGKPAGMEEIPKWPELQTSADMSERQVFARTTFLNKLLEVYKTAFDAIAPKVASGGTAGNMTAGEMATRDDKAAAMKRAKDYGVEDGKSGKRSRGEDIQNWKEVTELDGPDRAGLLHELIETYNKAFASVAPAGPAASTGGKTSAREMVARDRKAAALKRAGEMGTSDGKLGQKLSIEKIQAWPEVTELGGADLATFLHQLLEVYNKAFDAVPKKAGPTAGQMVERDKKDAALKRAREMGTRDGKAGSRVNLEDIQEWEVVTELEGAARGAFLHELLEAYNQAFEAVPVRLTAGEMVAGDKKTAAIQRARDWGSKDGKAGKVSDMKEIQTWPAVAELDPVARGPFIAQLSGVYNKAQAEAIAANKNPTRA